MKHTAYVLLGSNLGNRQAFIEKAIAMIRIQIGEVTATSSLYRAAAWGDSDDPEFLNQAIEVRTNLEAEEFLHELLKVEQQLGRVRTTKWAPRTIDLDVVFFDDSILKSDDLEVPHPRMQERRFVLMPLAEIAPTARHPVLGKSVSELLAECPDAGEVSILAEP